MSFDAFSNKPARDGGLTHERVQTTVTTPSFMVYDQEELNVNSQGKMWLRSDELNSETGLKLSKA